MKEAGTGPAATVVGSPSSTRSEVRKAASFSDVGDAANEQRVERAP